MGKGGAEVGHFAGERGDQVPAGDLGGRRRDIAKAGQQRLGRRLIVDEAVEYLKTDSEALLILDDPRLGRLDRRRPGNPAAGVFHAHAKREWLRRLDLRRQRIVGVHVALQEVVERQPGLGQNGDAVGRHGDCVGDCADRIGHRGADEIQFALRLRTAGARRRNDQPGDLAGGLGGDRTGAIERADPSQRRRREKERRIGVVGVRCSDDPVARRVLERKADRDVLDRRLEPVVDTHRRGKSLPLETDLLRNLELDFGAQSAGRRLRQRPGGECDQPRGTKIPQARESATKLHARGTLQTSAGELNQVNCSTHGHGSPSWAVPLQRSRRSPATSFAPVPIALLRDLVRCCGELIRVVFQPLVVCAGDWARGAHRARVSRLSRLPVGLQCEY